MAKRTVSGNFLKYWAKKFAIKAKYDGYQRRLASMVYKLFDKKIGLETNVNEVLAQQLHKPLLENSKKRKVYVRFRDNI